MHPDHTPTRYPHTPTHGFEEPVGEWYRAGETLDLLRWRLPVAVDLAAVLEDSFRSRRPLPGGDPGRHLLHMLPPGDGSARETVVRVTAGTLDAADAVTVHTEHRGSDPPPGTGFQGRCCEAWVDIVTDGVGLTYGAALEGGVVVLRAGGTDHSLRPGSVVDLGGERLRYRGPERVDGDALLRVAPPNAGDVATCRITPRALARRYALAHHLPARYRAAGRSPPG